MAVTADGVADFQGRVVLSSQFVEKIAFQFLVCVEWWNNAGKIQIRQAWIQGKANAVAFRFVLADGAKRLFLHIHQDNRTIEAQVQGAEAGQDGFLREHRTDI